MRDNAPRSRLTTHEVVNQPDTPGDSDLFAGDLPLREALEREAPAWVRQRLASLGREAGSLHVQALGEQANRHPPELALFDRHGRRLDEVRYHPAYHELMHLAIDNGWHAVAWQEEGRGGHQAHIAALYLLTQAEPGFCCPVTMTHAAMPVLRRSPDIEAAWAPGLLANAYDPRPLPAEQKRGLTFGMAMTEKQGGSDVRRNTTRAERDGEGWRLTGHKWFCSAPMSDAFLTLAQTDAGLTCFLAPRFTPDGERNAIELQRLKEKCGNRANASAEIEYRSAWASLVGEPGRGVATIIDMVQQTRLDAATAPVGMMRQALVEAWRHVRGRHAFGRLLAEQPLMQAVIADLALEVEAGVALVMRAARAFDGDARGEAHETALARVLPTLAKYWHNKRGPGFMAEAMECLGGIGYVEEAPLARLYREAPVNSIWEGSGNVICLDLLRVLARHPESIAALRDELRAAQGLQQDLDLALAGLEHDLALPAETLEPRARWLTQRLAQSLQGALLLRHAPAEVAETFCRSRLGVEASPAYGVLPAGSPLAEILARIGD
ncbi:MAG: acyl-CoA dehydrogenase family protein [Billgrantia sp.]|uniref:DNA alkylation response protein n=1 Tax=Billgrantia desiderata TaxID=52021 RepID=A0ABS9B3E8_9GAMM|nr:acyl-CoA dehydrogenase family protein [Halomonas desiderata]MCE8042243.1 DNA alkylation response protein [Halomonas desiderata]MCE8046612.1 DNA alkylation response protein [Halomonas desiderata]OUE46967.1 DNA alkylation response protein [Halomonas desiderata SP1]SEF69168.1 putative acyl-CoA dehydrogenase [Halomonas desiderata]